MQGFTSLFLHHLNIFSLLLQNSQDHKHNQAIEMDTGKGKAPVTIEAEQSQSTNKAKAETSWTGCYGCKMRYEYPKVFIKQKIICSKCLVPFEALETPPRNKPISKPQVRHNKKQRPKRKGRRNEQAEELRQMLIMKGRKETTSLLDRLKRL